MAIRTTAPVTVPMIAKDIFEESLFEALELLILLPKLVELVEFVGILEFVEFVPFNVVFTLNELFDV